jgi:sugar phosphate isomerase/epimerase
MSKHDQDPGATERVSRRGFLTTAAVATAGLAVAPSSYAAGFARTPGYVQASGPNSRFGNVQIGTITYSFRSMPGANDPEQVLSYIVAAGLSSTELMGEPILRFLGAPTTTAPNPNQINQMTDPAQREAAQRQRAAYDTELNRFFASPDMNRVAELKKLFNDAGVNIHLTKLNANTPEAAEFAFRVARALGARGNSAEVGEDAARVQGPIAQRHGVVTAMHNHAQPGNPNFVGFDRILAASPGVALNLDVGHYYGSTGRSPIPEIRRLNQRIVSFHLKDKTSPEEGDQNMPWGLGGTPLPEVLRLVNRENYSINGDIELEYEIPEGSNAVKEVARCLEYCREVLSRPVPTPRGPGAMPAAPTTAAPRP